MIDEASRREIEKIIDERFQSASLKITQMMIPNNAIKQRHIGEGVRYLRSVLAAELPATGDFEGEVYYLSDSDVLKIWDGSAWQSH